MKAVEWINLNKARENGGEVSLQGTALRIYWHLIRQRTPTGIRDIQRALRLSSPSLVRHHLDHLEQAGLVQQTREGPVAVRNIRVGALEMFIGFGRLQLPRQIFYAAFFSTILIFFVIFGSRVLTMETVLLMGVLVFGLVSSIYEAWRTWRSAPW